MKADYERNTDTYTLHSPNIAVLGSVENLAARMSRSGERTNAPPWAGRTAHFPCGKLRFVSTGPATA